jgi:formate dehydrogenase maturation protein FdhE
MERLAMVPLVMEAWTRRRRRARQLAERQPFAAEMLRLYQALLDAQERAFLRTLDDRPEPATLATYVADRVIADVARATAAAGPPLLAIAVRDRLRDGEPSALVAAWLAGAWQVPVDGYLGRAAAGPVLEALGPAAGAACARPAAEGGCPRCGGLPQVSYLTEAGESLVSGPRMLLCCRCGESWIHPRMTCVGCGESSTARLPIFADAERLPHLRADACETCRRYVITVDLRKDAEAVPVVDELVALPLDLHVQELGFAKIVANLMAIG